MTLRLKLRTSLIRSDNYIAISCKLSNLAMISECDKDLSYYFVSDTASTVAISSLPFSKRFNAIGSV